MTDAPDMLRVHAFDYLTGEWLHDVELSAAQGDRAPDGTWLVPGNCTTIAPPQTGTLQAAIWRDGAWHVVPDHRGETWYRADRAAVLVQDLGDPGAAGLLPTQPAPPPPTPADLHAHLAALRYARETGGTTWNGHAVATDRESQAKLTAAFVMAGALPTFAIPAWKLPDGSFIALANAEVKALAGAVLAHVQGCFTTEKAVADRIAASELATTAAVETAFAAAGGA